MSLIFKAYLLFPSFFYFLCLNTWCVCCVSCSHQSTTPLEKWEIFSQTPTCHKSWSSNSEVTENNSTPWKNSPLGKGPQYHAKDHWKQGGFQSKSQKMFCESLPKWECFLRKGLVSEGGDSWSLPETFLFLVSSFVWCLKCSLIHWKVLHSVSESTRYSHLCAVYFKTYQANVRKHKLHGVKDESVLSSTAHIL